MSINQKDLIDGASLVKTVIDGMKAVSGAFANLRLRKKQKEQIEREAKKLLSLATGEEIDIYVAVPRKVAIDARFTAVKRSPARAGGSPGPLGKKRKASRRKKITKR